MAFQRIPSRGSGLMRRILMISLFALAALFLGGLTLAMARPQWMPAWARIDPERLPAWARFRGHAPAAEDAGLYCKEHGVPEKFCTLCHEELTKSLMLCKEHGNIPEDICTKCHPDVEKKYNIEMCPKGHGLPKEFCVECGKVTSASAALPDDGWCATHNKPEAECPECAKDPRKISPVAAGEVPRACRRPLPTVKFASAKLVRQV